MGFGDWNNNNQGGQTGYEGGFNAEDYMTNLEDMTSKGPSKGNLLKGFWADLKGDLGKSELSWM